jgi:hypothetical protein
MEGTCGRKLFVASRLSPCQYVSHIAPSHFQTGTAGPCTSTNHNICIVEHHNNIWMEENLTRGVESSHTKYCIAIKSGMDSLVLSLYVFGANYKRVPCT